MDIITVKINIENESLTVDEKSDLIISDLREIADLIEEQNGDVQQLKGKNDDSTIEYVHLKQN